MSLFSWIENLLLTKEKKEKAKTAYARIEECAAQNEADAQAQATALAEIRDDAKRVEIVAEQIRNTPLRPLRLASLPDIDAETEEKK